MFIRMRTLAIFVGLVIGPAASQSLLTACSGTLIAYQLSGFFGNNVVSGSDKLKLEGERFSITLYACASQPPTKSGSNYAIYFPVTLTGTVKSALLDVPYKIKPAPVTLTLADPGIGSDFVKLEGPVEVAGGTINILGIIGLPAGTLTSASVAAFWSVPIVAAQSAFIYAQGTESTTLSVIGTATGTVYTGAAAPVSPFLHDDGVQVIVAHADGTLSSRPMQATPVDLGAPQELVMLRFYASGVRDASVVQVRIAGQDVPVIYFGAAGYFPDLDEVTVEVPHSLAGLGDADVVLTADGQTASPVRIHIQ